MRLKLASRSSRSALHAKTKSARLLLSEDILERAEAFFQEGFALLEQGQRAQAAIISLSAAARTFPGCSISGLTTGRALASSEDTRRLAETELQAAIKLDPTTRLIE